MQAGGSFENIRATKVVPGSSTSGLRQPSKPFVPDFGQVIDLVCVIRWMCRGVGGFRQCGRSRVDLCGRRFRREGSFAAVTNSLIAFFDFVESNRRLLSGQELSAEQSSARLKLAFLGTKNDARSRGFGIRSTENGRIWSIGLELVQRVRNQCSDISEDLSSLGGLAL